MSQRVGLRSFVGKLPGHFDRLPTTTFQRSNFCAMSLSVGTIPENTQDRLSSATIHFLVVLGRTSNASVATKIRSAATAVGDQRGGPVIR